MADSDFLGTGVAFPFSMDGGRMRMAAGKTSIRESIFSILRTQRGERVMRPEFGAGLYELTFADNNTSTHTLVAETVRLALLEYEPRITVQNIQVVQDPDESTRLNIDISYTVITSNNVENVVYPFYLEGGV